MISGLTENFQTGISQKTLKICRPRFNILGHADEFLDVLRNCHLRLLGYTGKFYAIKFQVWYILGHARKGTAVIFQATLGISRPRCILQAMTQNWGLQQRIEIFFEFFNFQVCQLPFELSSQSFRKNLPDKKPVYLNFPQFFYRSIPVAGHGTRFFFSSPCVCVCFVQFSEATIIDAQTFKKD